jgi:type II secretory ATPase GspE/PulE/Tfp pilus assembly ATPase PilB-like protein
MQQTPQPLSRHVEDELARGGDISIIALVNGLLHEAHARRASDIHIDPTAAEVRVRLRVDGVLHQAHTLPKNIHGEIISRVKVLAGLRTDEHQAAQDGRFRYALPDAPAQKACYVDLRVSIVPSFHGETLVMRLLSDRAEHYSLEMLGFSEGDRQKIETAISKQSGMILATGPTGSGKTTTLYTLLKMLNAPGVSLVTIEDPIEYSVEGVEQIQVNPRAGLTFSSGLRSILRQDPNVIMVGEIRDAETAAIAVNTALTGHLLLSTLHTSDAATTLPRLLDLGLENYLVSSTVNIAVGQRLVRKLCLHCKERSLINGERLFKPRGCEKCANSGYNGRISISEVLVAGDEIREAIVRKAPAAELKKIAVTNGMTTMFEDGFAKARAGETTLEEILRVIHE